MAVMLKISNGSRFSRSAVSQGSRTFFVPPDAAMREHIIIKKKEGKTQHVEIQEEEEEDEELQINDPEVIFNAVYSKLKRLNEDRDLVFPKEVIWLIGAPGSGKGTHSIDIMESRGITAEPIVMSNLLVSSESQEAKNKGKLVADAYVLEKLLAEMVKPIYDRGVIIDGFPRNLIQAHFIRLLHSKMKALRELHGRPYRRPMFRVAVLWVSEQVSIERQIKRGREARQANEERKKKGLQPLPELERATDFDTELSRERYRTFKENYSVIETLKQSFHFSVIDGKHCA